MRMGVLGSNEDIEHMDTDTHLEVDISCETGYTNIASGFEPMEVDKGADVRIERWPIDSSESRLKKRILAKESWPEWRLSAGGWLDTTRSEPSLRTARKLYPTG